MTRRSRFVLGTAQFGLNYGVTTQRGRIESNEAQEILKEAKRAGVTILDTASAYGDAEESLGVLNVTGQFRVVTKIVTDDAESVPEEINKSRDHLKTAALDTVLLHRFSSFKSSPDIWDAMLASKRQGNVGHVGVSLYYPEEWNDITTYCNARELPYPDAVQVPLSVFDQRFVPLLSGMKAAGCEIFVRSVFLQGLGFMSENSLSEYFQPIAPTLRGLSEIEENYRLNRAAVLFSFPLGFQEVDHVVVGIDGLSTFQSNIEAYDLADAHIVNTSVGQWSDLRIEDEALLIPMNWPSTGNS